LREHIWKTANGAATATDGFPLEPPARRSMPWKNAGLRVSHPPPTSLTDCGQHWEKLRVVSFAYPLIPAVFLLVGGWITIQGIRLKPIISACAIVTIAVGALIYHFRIRPASRSSRAAQPYRAT